MLNVCSTRNTGRMLSVRYEYLGLLREIDLHTFFEAITPKHHTATHQIIECKKTTKKHWVFFSTPSYGFSDVTFFLKYASAFDVYFKKNGTLPLLARIYERLGATRHHYSDSALPRCIAYTEAFRDNSKQSEIYKAIDSVITYLSYRREYRVRTLEEFETFSEFYLPIIVIDGLLFEARVEGENVSVRPQSLQERSAQGFTRFAHPFE